MTSEVDDGYRIFPRAKVDDEEPPQWGLVCEEYQRPRSMYVFGKFLGKGSHGQVMEATYSGGLQKYAVKEQVAVTYKDVMLKLWEGTILQQLSHPNVVQFIDTFFLSREEGLFYVFLVMELCDESLADFIEKSKLQLRPKLGMPENQVLGILRQLVEMLNYIHSQKVKDFGLLDCPEGTIIHRDFKPKNILVKWLDGQMVLKLADFGISRVVQGSAKTHAGYLQYIAPEVQSGRPYDHKADMYSLGAILYNICTFTDCSLYAERAQVARDLMHPPSPNSSGYSLPLTSLISSLLSQDPADRPTAGEILALPWVASIPTPSTSLLSTITTTTTTTSLTTTHPPRHPPLLHQRHFSDVVQSHLPPTTASPPKLDSESRRSSFPLLVKSAVHAVTERFRGTPTALRKKDIKKLHKELMSKCGVVQKKGWKADKTEDGEVLEGCAILKAALQEIVRLQGSRGRVAPY